MKICRRVWWLGALAAGVASLIGCDGSGPTQTVVEDVQKIVLLSARGDRPFEVGQRILLARLMANETRFQLRSLDAAFSLDSQIAQFKEAAAENPLAILLDPLDPTPPLKAEVAAATAAGILVIGLGEDAATLGCTTALMTDQRKLGELAGQLTVRALAAKAIESGQPETVGRVLEIRGDDESRACQHRHEGFVQALKAAPGVILVHDAPGDWGIEGGRSRTYDAIRLQQSIDVVYAHNDLMALGAAQHLVHQKKRAEVMVIGTDGFRGREGGMTLVGDGEIDATLYQPLLVDFAWIIIKKKLQTPTFQPKPTYDMPLRTILPKDVDDIRRTGLPAYPAL